MRRLLRHRLEGILRAGERDADAIGVTQTCMGPSLLREESSMDEGVAGGDVQTGQGIA